MAENLGASFSIDVTNLKAGLRTANAMIRESESEFRKAAAGMDDWSKSQEGLEAKIKSLNDIAKIQRDKVEALKKEYDKLVKEGLDPTSDKAVKLRTNINNEETALAKTETELVKNKTALQNFGTESDKATTEVKELADQTDKGAGKFGAMDVALGNLVASGIKSAIKGFQDLAKFAVDAYKAVDEGSDNVIRATGATGKEAEELEKAYKNVAKTFKGDFGEIGTVLGEVNTRFGYTGEELEEATKQFLRFADVTGADAKTAVADTSRALKAAGMSDKDYAKLLDQMATAAQKSGISVSTLSEQLVKNGTTFRDLGYDTEQTIALLAQFEAAGVNTDTAIQGLKTANVNWAKEGKNAREEFGKTMQAIKDAPTDVEKTQIAIDNFGKKAGPEFADAVKTGRTEYGDFVKALENSQGTVDETYDQTKDAFDDVNVAIQNVKVGFSNFVSDILQQYGPQLKEGLGMIGNFISNLVSGIFTFTESLGETLVDIGNWIADVAAKIGDLADKWAHFILGIKHDVGQEVVASQFESIQKNGNAVLDAVDEKKRQQVADENQKKIDAEAQKLSKNYPGVPWSALQDMAKKKLGIKTINYLAKGGIVHSATQAIIGEHGAEVVMPLENNTEWIDKLAEKLGGRGGVNVYQTNNYAQAHSRYEIWQSEKNIQKAVKAAVR